MSATTHSSPATKVASRTKLDPSIRSLNDQPDVLTSLLVHYGGIKDKVGHVQIKDCDEKGFTLSSTLLSFPYDPPRSTWIAFSPPLNHSSEAGARILAMSDSAFTSLSVSLHPSLPTWVPPPIFPHAALIFSLLSFQLLTYLAPRSLPPFVALKEALGMRVIGASYAFLVVAHVAEAVWFGAKLSGRGVGGRNLRNYVLCTLAGGLVVAGPHYKRQNQLARIREIYARVLPSTKGGAESKKTR